MTFIVRLKYLVLIFNTFAYVLHTKDLSFTLTKTSSLKQIEFKTSDTYGTHGEKSPQHSINLRPPASTLQFDPGQLLKRRSDATKIKKNQMDPDSYWDLKKTNCGSEDSKGADGRGN